MGVPTPEKCVNLFFGKTFAENCMKMKEIGLNLGGGGILSGPLRPATTGGSTDLVFLPISGKNMEWEKDPWARGPCISQFA